MVRWLLTGAAAVALIVGLLFWWKSRVGSSATIERPPSLGPTSGGLVMRSGPDVGRDTMKISENGPLSLIERNVSMNLPGTVAPYTLNNPEVLLSPNVIEAQEKQTMARQALFNTDDHNIDESIQRQWNDLEIQFQENTGQMGPDSTLRTGQVWLKNWEALGPIDPFVPRQENEKVSPSGPTDPQLAYANSLVAAMDAQDRKFSVTENPDDITHVYRNTLQQLPGSHYEVFEASYDSEKTPQVVERRAHLPQEAARWVVGKLNEKFRAEHPCFSLAGREHFELSNPPMNCGDPTNPKESPITLIRVFESRLQSRVPERPGDVAWLLYLTMEIGNHVSTGSGGMFHTIVKIDNFGKFVEYTSLDRDKKQTFVLPRTRT